MDLSEIKSYFSDDLIEEIKPLSLVSEKEQTVQNYLEKIAQRLIGDEWDFEKHPVYFAITDDKDPNAAFFANPKSRVDIVDEGTEDERRVKVELPTVPMIYVTKGLMNFVQNEDELAFILGHELGHFRENALRGEHDNTKVEEASSDYGALDMMAKAGYNLSAARNIAGRIFTTDEQSDSLKVIIQRSLDAHPNNESRLNFMDVSIVGLTKSLRKQNIEASVIEPRAIAEEVKDIVASERYISFVDKYLASHDYVGASLLQRLSILRSCMREAEVFGKEKDSYRESYLISSPRSEDLTKEFAVLLSDMREELPRHLVSESDAEICTHQYFRDNTEEMLARKKEIFGEGSEHIYDGWGNDKKATQILSKFPYLVVADDQIEQLSVENEAKRRQEVLELEKGTHINLQFLDALYADTQEPDLHKSRSYISSLFIGAATIGLETIPLNDNWEMGKEIKTQAQEFLENGSHKSSEVLNSVNLQIKQNDYNIVEHNNSLASIKNINAYRSYPHFSELFSGFPQVDLIGGIEDVGKSVPNRWKSLRHDLVDMFGIKKDSLKFDKEDKNWVLSYRDPKQGENAPNSYYVIDEQGVITAYYAANEYEKMVADLEKRVQDSVYSQVVKAMRADKKQVEDFLQNPDISNVSLKDLQKMKDITKTVWVGRDNDLVPPEGMTSNEYYAVLRDKYYAEELEYKKSDIRDLYYNEFYSVKENSPYYTDGMYIQGSVLKTYLTLEEQNWFETYNHLEDMEIFKAYQDKLVSEAHNPLLKASEYTTGPGIHDEEARFDRIASYIDRLSPSERMCFSYRQSVDISRTILDNYALKSSFRYADSDWRINNMVAPDFLYRQELRNLAVYVAGHGGIEKADFSDYKPLFGEQVRRIAQFEAFNPQQIEAYVNRVKEQSSSYYDNSGLMYFEVMQYILQNKEHDLPLESSLPLLEAITFKQDMAYKLIPFLAKEENWPQDTVKSAKVAEKLYNAKLVAEPEAVIEFFISKLRGETDAARAESVVITLSGIINNSDIDYQRQNKLKDNLMEAASGLWNQPLAGKLATFQNLCKADLFSQDMVLQNKILTDFIPQIEKHPNLDEKIEFCYFLLKKENRIDDPDIRRDYQKLWVENVFKKMESRYDDNSAAYLQQIIPYVEAIKKETIKGDRWGKSRKEEVALVDRLEILKFLADKVVSQQALSNYIEPQPSGMDSMESKDLVSGHVAGVTFDAVKAYVSSSPKHAESVINFLLSNGSKEECDKCSQGMVAHANKALNYNLGGADKLILKNCSPERLSLLYREFWLYPLEARAVMINELLHSQASNSKGEKWESIFNIVADKVFPNTDSSMSSIGKEFLHSYIKSRSNEEKTLYLSAMMVAANGNSATTDPEKSIARGIRLFLENSGPAAIKLGQAMASYPDVPKFIRDEMQELKSNAARPARWDIYKWLDNYKTENPNEKLEFGKDVWLGRILGSASYFVTLEKGAFENGQLPKMSDKVIKILRAGAELDSKSEFGVFEKMLYDLGEKGVMTGGIDTFIRLVKQAQSSSIIETDLTIGKQQLETAKTLYPNTVEINGRKFDIHVADWPQHGKRWAELERANGLDLDQIRDEGYRRDVSKAYFTVEMVNMFSGGRFDHDRHGKQLKIDVEKNVIGLFDTGAMAVVDPSPRDKELLGRILYKTANELMSAENGASFGKVGEILSGKIEEAYKSGETNSTYLTEFQRGLLALNDFYKDFEAKDFVECFNAALNNPNMPLDKNLIKGFVSQGVSTIGLFSAEQNLLSYEDKERMGRLMFNVYAASLNSEGGNIKEVIVREIENMSKADVESIPLLKVISKGLNDKSSSQNMALNLPEQFVPALSSMIGNQNADVAILKGMMKEVVNTVTLQEDKKKYSKEDRQAFGKILYQTFALSLQDKKQGKTVNMIASFEEAVKASPEKSVYANKVYAVLKVAKNAELSGGEIGVDMNTLMKNILLQGNLDKEISAGITKALLEQNPDSITRQFMAKGMKYFLSQKSDDQSLLKKGLVRLFVKKKITTGDIKDKILPLAESKELNKAFVQVLQGYVETAGKELAKERKAPQINLVSSKNVAKII